MVLVGSGRLTLLFRDLPRDLFLLTLELGGFSRCSTGSLSRVSVCLLVFMASWAA